MKIKMKTTRSKASAPIKGRVKARTGAKTRSTTMKEAALAKRDRERRNGDDYEDPDEEVFLALCAVFFRHGVFGDRTTRILKRMLYGVHPVVCDSVQ